MKRFLTTFLICLIVSVTATVAYAQQTAEELVRSSQARLATRDLDGALNDLDRAIAIKPDYAEAYLRRASLRMMKRQLDEALQDVGRAIELDPTRAEAYALRGRMRNLKGDREGALADFDAAVARNYRTDEVFAERGRIKLMGGNVREAIDDLTVAISINPARVSYYLARANARSKMNDEEGALADYSYVIEGYERDARERAASGKAERRTPPADLQSAPISGPETKLPSQDNGKTERTVRTEVVVTMTTDKNFRGSPQELEYLPNVAGAYTNRALIYARRGEADAAMADLDRAVAVDPNGWWPLFSRGSELQKRGNLSASLADLNRAVELNPQMPVAYLERGVTRLLMGDEAGAQKDFDKAVSLSPRLQQVIESRRAEAAKKKNSSQ